MSNAPAENGPVVIAGAGQAGFSVAAKLRDLGHSGRITLVGAEPHPPYQRPPLSKGLLGDFFIDLARQYGGELIREPFHAHRELARIR